MDEDEQARYLLARTKIWTPELDKLLRKWKKQIGKKEQGHTELSRKYGQRHYIFGLPSTLLSGIVSAGSFSTFENCDSNKDCATTEYVRLTFGILALVATTLTILQTFMNFQERSSDHKKAADNYAELYRDIDSLLILPVAVRGDPVSTLQGLRSRYDDIARRAPTLPKKYDDIDLTYEVATPIPRAPKANHIVLNPPSHLHKSGIQPIEAMLEEDLDKSDTTEVTDTGTLNSTEIEENIAIRNDYSTDDSDKEVCLPYDLDCVLNYDPTAAAVAMSRLEAQRQKSLQRTLEFEMDRLNGSPRSPSPKSSPRRGRKSKKSRKVKDVEEE